jgi:hypothetical protein
MGHGSNPELTHSSTSATRTVLHTWHTPRTHTLTQRVRLAAVDHTMAHFSTPRTHTLTQRVRLAAVDHTMAHFGTF